jgi:hypothetical protein
LAGRFHALDGIDFQTVPYLLKSFSPTAIGHKSVVTDRHQTVRQHVQEKPTHKFLALQAHTFAGASRRVVLVTEDDVILFHRLKPVIANGLRWV